MMKLLIRVAIFAAVVSLCAVAFLVSSHYLGKPKPSVDYLAIINRPALEAKDHEKGWSIYRDLRIKYGNKNSGWDSSIIFLPDENGNRLGRFVCPDDGVFWEEAIAAFAEADDLLEGLRVAGVRPSYGLPLYVDFSQYEASDLQALFPDRDYRSVLAENQNSKERWEELRVISAVSTTLKITGHIRDSARLLHVDTRWAIEQGDAERAIRNIEAVLGMSMQMTETKFFSTSLSAFFVHTIGLDLIDGCVHSKIDFSDQQLERIHTAVKKSRIEDMVDVSTEELMFLDLVQHFYTDDGKGNGRITADGLEHWSGLSSMLFAPTRKQLTDKANNVYDRLNRVLKDVAGEQPSVTLEDLEEIVAESAGFPPLHGVLQNYLNTYQAIIRARANAHGVDVALAVLRFERKHGRMPESLNDLVGEFLTQIPHDPVDGQPLRYLRQSDGFLVYSVGANQVDDGGQPLLVRPDGSVVHDPKSEENAEQLLRMGPYSYNTDTEKPGDWILWPRYVYEQERLEK